MWTDTVSTFALHNADVHPVVEEMWGHLSAAVKFFMRHQPGQHTDEHIDAAQDHLLQYGRLVQQTWNMKELMTHNLHTCICHVPEQAKLCGPTAFAGEWWLERLMQVFKRVTKYRCTRYPETTAVQHWLTMAALDDTRLRFPQVTRLLDDIRAGRPTAEGTRDSAKGTCWLSGKLSKVDRDGYNRLAEVFESVEKHHGMHLCASCKLISTAVHARVRVRCMHVLPARVLVVPGGIHRHVQWAHHGQLGSAGLELVGGDGGRVTLDLQSEDLFQNEEGVTDKSGFGVPKVRLTCSPTATINSGAALLRTDRKQLKKQDWHALVPFSVEVFPPVAAAEAAQAAVQSLTQLRSELEGLIQQLEKAQAEAVTETSRDLQSAKESADRAEFYALTAEEKTELRALQATDSEARAGIKTFGDEERTTQQLAQAAGMTALQVAERLKGAVDSLRPVNGPARQTCESLYKEASQYARECCQLARALPEQCALPPNPSPESHLTVLEVQHLLRWQQKKDGREITRRLAVGKMRPVKPVQNAQLQFETVFCDGTLCRRRRVPSMLKPVGTRSYDYAVWLDSVAGAMVAAKDGKGKLYYLPTNKTGLRG